MFQDEIRRQLPNFRYFSPLLSFSRLFSPFLFFSLLFYSFLSFSLPLVCCLSLSIVIFVQDLLDWCLQLILCESFDSINCSFANVAAKLAARLIQAKPDIFSLPIVCGDYHLSTDLDRVEKFFINWLLPLCFRLGTGRYGELRLISSFSRF